MSKSIGGIAHDAVGNLLGLRPSKSLSNRSRARIGALLLFFLCFLSSFTPLSAHQGLTDGYDKEGQRVWARELDIYGRTRSELGEVGFIPFLYQGQYLDQETGLAYNRFRYYSPETGAYISQDPIRLEAGLSNFYAYVHDVNAWVDVFGLKKITFKTAFRIAKQKLRIPSNVNPLKPRRVFDSENRIVWAFSGEHSGKFIIMHDQDKHGRGVHLHTATISDEAGNIHPSPLDRGRYNQHKGHIPQDVDGIDDATLPKDIH